MSNIKIEIDLYKDFIEIIKNLGKIEGININSEDSEDEICYKYFNHRLRIIDPQPRRIHISKEFNYPQAVEEGLKVIKRKLERGDDLKPHLHKPIKKAQSNVDKLLYDWGFHHLHLGTELEQDSEFIERTGPVLIVKVTLTDAYFIQIVGHNNWEKKELLEIVDNNWPHLIAAWKLENVIGLSHNPDEDDLKKLRKGNVNAGIQLSNGNIYLGPGGGLASSGHSSLVVQMSLRYSNALKRLQKWILNNPKAVQDDLCGKCLKKINPMVLKLSHEPWGFEIMENTTKTIFKRLDW